ncbi:MAG TPA: PBP1A family penicillin-binding protein [Rubrivivax sp.]|nr:PBP1A family penicillin-binding protein [Rubrivivax sp.]
MKHLQGQRSQRGLIVLSSLLLAALAAAAVAALVLAFMAIWYWHDLPTLDKATAYRPRQHLQVLTADGAEIAQFGTERRIFVPIAQAPKLLQDAVLAVEDHDFYNHHGISFRGMARAAWSHATGGIGGGASTITQQVSRTFFLSTRRTIERKLKEALIAWQLERELGKDGILELYLNQIYLGQRAYGYGAAAQVYFGKPLVQLNLAETAMLAGLQQNPIYANPIVNNAAATRRQHWVLHRMVATGVISDAQRRAALATPLVYRKPSFVDVPAQHVAEMARRAVVERLGEKAYTEGVRVFTSVRAEEQRVAHAALRRAVLAHERKQAWSGPEGQEKLPEDAEEADQAAALALKDLADDEDLRVAIVLAASPTAVTAKLASGENVTIKADALRRLQSALSPKADPALAIRRGAVLRVQLVPRGKANEWQIAQWPQADAAFVALDPVTGRVRALVGGFDFNRQQFNRATSAARQPGSSFKPFLYSAALEHGLMPETQVNDAPLLNPDGSVPNWNPQNSDGKFDGEISMREGLVRSKNLVSVRLLQHIGLTQAHQWMGRFGLPMDKQPKDLTLALGTGSVTPLQLAQAYAVFANGGHRVTPVLIERIVDAQGKLLFEAPPAPPLNDDTRVVPARNVFMVNTLLSDVTLRGTAASAKATLRRPDLYGKTGTTNDAVDAWFAGFGPGAVAVAWMGYDEPRSLGERESGGGLALPIWIEAMTRLLRGVPVQALVAPGGIVSVGNDWRYAEYAEGGFVPRVGINEPRPGPTTTTDAGGAAASAASSSTQ